jgi:hypothetical protein
MRWWRGSCAAPAARDMALPGAGPSGNGQLQVPVHCEARLGRNDPTGPARARPPTHRPRRRASCPPPSYGRHPVVPERGQEGRLQSRPGVSARAA